MEQILVDEKFAKVKYDPDKKLGMIIWNGAVDKQQYRHAFNALLDFAEKRARVDYYLSDIRNQGVVGPENRKWFEENALPKAVGLGLKKAAVIFDGNVFKKYYVNLVLQMTNKYKLPMKLVNSREEAEVFLFQAERRQA